MEYSKECSDVFFILNNLEKEERQKIPREVFEFLDCERDKEYDVTIRLDIPIYEQNLKEETVELLSEVYQKYLCSNEEKIKYIRQKHNENQESPSNIAVYDIFKNDETSNNENINNHSLPIEIKEKSIFQKIYEKLKIWLKIK